MPIDQTDEKRPILSDNFGSYFQILDDDRICIVVFDEDAAGEEQHVGHAHSCRLTVYSKEFDEQTGLPSKEELADLYPREDDLLVMLESAAVDCRLVGRMTYRGLREIFFQTQDVEPFMNVFEEWKGKHPLEVELKTEEGWRVFDEFLSPDMVHRQQVDDQAVIDQLIENGSDPEKPHSLEHTFVGSAENLSKVEEILTADAFGVVRKEAELLVMNKLSTLDICDVWSVTTRLYLLAESVDVEYDGWGCLVVR